MVGVRWDRQIEREVGGDGRKQRCLEIPNLVVCICGIDDGVVVVLGIIIKIIPIPKLRLLRLLLVVHGMDRDEGNRGGNEGFCKGDGDETPAIHGNSDFTYTANIWYVPWQTDSQLTASGGLILINRCDYEWIWDESNRNVGYLEWSLNCCCCFFFFHYLDLSSSTSSELSHWKVMSCFYLGFLCNARNPVRCLQMSRVDGDFHVRVRC